MSLSRIAIIGGGPSALFSVKKLLDSGYHNFIINIFEKNYSLGCGMPYSVEGALDEHLTNVSSDELPPLCETLYQWIKKQSVRFLNDYGIHKQSFHEKQVVPRILFGFYLKEQFSLLLTQAHDKGINIFVYTHKFVTDVVPYDNNDTFQIQCHGDSGLYLADYLIICTGHVWTKTHEDKVQGYYDSPYPPAKLQDITNHTIALKGSSLTAIDAINTLAHNNGIFKRSSDDRLQYEVHENCKDFKIIMHSREGLLPSIRFHMQTPCITEEKFLSEEDISAQILQNHGFLSLDYLFEKDFKEVLKKRDQSFYKRIKGQSLEEFVDFIMDERKDSDPFDFFIEEFQESMLSIKNERPIHWKEVLAIFSFVINYPAKYLSAEDMLRLKKVLQPLLSIIVAYVPKESCELLLALHDAKRLELLSVGYESEVIVEDDHKIKYVYTDENDIKHHDSYEYFIDCTGQKSVPLSAFPFPSLVDAGYISQALLRFNDQLSAKGLYDNEENAIVKADDGDYYLTVGGIAINDYYQVVQKNGFSCNQIFIISVPHMTGFNPDYSGLDFSDEASTIIIDRLLFEIHEQKEIHLNESSSQKDDVSNQDMTIPLT